MKFGENNKVRGPGRPKGSKNPDTIVIEQAKNKFKVRASRLAARILATQAINAMGTHTLMRIDEIVHYRNDGKTDKQGNEVKSRYVERKFVVVTDPNEIETVMNDFQDMDGSGVIDGKYYFITHEKPNNQAADSILNRAWGKPKETIEVVPEKEIDPVKKVKTQGIISKYLLDFAKKDDTNEGN